MIIFSAVRSNEQSKFGFLTDRRRVNVALSRAKFGLVVVGNSRMMLRQRIWKAVVEHSRALGGFVEGGGFAGLTEVADKTTQRAFNIQEYNQNC